MANKTITRRDALKIMGAGATTLAAASVLSPIAQAKSILPDILALEAEEHRFDALPQDFKVEFKEKEVLSTPDVVIRQIDEHTWLGTGHLMSNESIYIIEGSKAALLIDMGTKIEDLDKIVAKITKKPIIPVATHVHPDHTGSAIDYFPELWINAADTVNIASIMPQYKGKLNYLSDGQVFDLGGREIEVIFTPGHTPGSTIFIDKAKKYGFSGDAFGSGNLLLITNFSTLLATTTRIEAYVKKYGITHMYPGHYFAVNAETPERISNLKKMASEVLDGTRKSEKTDNPSFGLDGLINDYGVNIRYKIPDALK